MVRPSARPARLATTPAALLPEAGPGMPPPPAEGSCTWRARPCSDQRQPGQPLKCRANACLPHTGQQIMRCAYLIARAAWSYARAASSAVSNVPSQRRAPTVGSRISAAHLPQGRWRTPLQTEAAGGNRVFQRGTLGWPGLRTTAHRLALQRSPPESPVLAAGRLLGSGH